MIVSQGARFYLQMEWEVQPGEDRTISQGVNLTVLPAPFLLEGHIWYRQGCAARHGAAGIRTGAGGSSGIRIQMNPSFDKSSAAFRLSIQFMRQGPRMAREMSKKIIVLNSAENRDIMN